MGKAENRNKSQAHAEYMKARGITRKTAQCPWGCGFGYSTVRDGALMDHLNRCQGGGAKKRNRLTSVVGRVAKRTKR